MKRSLRETAGNVQMGDLGFRRQMCWFSATNQSIYTILDAKLVVTDPLDPFSRSRNARERLQTMIEK